MKKTPKKATPRKSAKKPDLGLILAMRLTELEAELRLYPTLAASHRALKSIKDPKKSEIGKNPVVTFTLNKKAYATGHTDMSYAAANHARGVRHIRFYADEKLVLDIEGDFYREQYGASFKFQSTRQYVPGDWEKDFTEVSDAYRQMKDERKSAQSQIRADAYRKEHASPRSKLIGLDD